MEKIKSLLSKESYDTSIDINQMVSYERINKDEVWLHIENAQDLSLSEKLKFVKEGFSSLAKILQSVPEYAEVKKVSGMSWIVSKNPKLLESFGFTVAENLKGLEGQLEEYVAREEEYGIPFGDTPGYAYIDKDKFINLYANQDASLNS